MPDFPLFTAGMAGGNMLARLHLQSLVDPTGLGPEGERLGIQLFVKRKELLWHTLVFLA